jgi:hypothetical protein
MNDFGRDIKGLMAVLKPRNYYKKPSTVAERTFKVIGGSGCNPDPAWGRRIEVKEPDGLIEEISSYDLDYVIDEDGKKIHQAVQKESDCYRADSPAAKPVLPPVPEKHLAKRKRG